MFLVQVGWVLGPDSLMKHLRTVHQNSIYHCATQCQVRGRGQDWAWPGEGRAQIGVGQERPSASSKVRSHLTCSPPPLHPPPRPPQAAVAQSFEREQLHFGQPSSYFVQFPQYIQRCRDHMIQSLQSVGLRPVIPQGSYFLITDISDFSKWARPGGAGAGALEAAQDPARPLSPRKQDA